MTEDIITGVIQRFSHLHLCKGPVIAAHVEKTHHLRDQSGETAKKKSETSHAEQNLMRREEHKRSFAVVTVV